MPLFNKESDVLDSIASVKMQTIADWELVVVDDGSTDSGPEKVLALDDHRIRMHRQRNAGVSAARNRGIDVSTCEVIAFLDADDVWNPGFLESILDLVHDFPKAQWFATGYERYDQLGRVTPARVSGLAANFSRGILPSYFFIGIQSDPPVCASAIALKRDAIKAIGGFPVGIKDGEDLLTWARLAVLYPIAYDINRLACYNFSDISRKPDPKFLVGKELEFLHQENPLILHLREYIGLWYRMEAVKAFKFQQVAFARQCAWRSFCYGPRQWRNGYTLLLTLLPPTLAQLLDRFLRRLANA